MKKSEEADEARKEVPNFFRVEVDSCLADFLVGVRRRRHEEPALHERSVDMRGFSCAELRRCERVFKDHYQGGINA